MSEWKTIDTAPKDKDIIIYDMGVYTACWDDKWVDNARGSLYFEPTHWMPLPEAPE